MNDGYLPSPIPTGHIELSHQLVALVERLAENAHDIWATGRMDQGWTHGAERDDHAKLHPCLIPYQELPESEKEMDRKLVRGTVLAILALGYDVAPADRRSTTT